MALTAHQLLHLRALMADHPGEGDAIRGRAIAMERGNIPWPQGLLPGDIHDWEEKPEVRDEMMQGRNG